MHLRFLTLHSQFALPGCCTCCHPPLHLEMDMAHDAALIPVHTLKAQMGQCARAALLLVVFCSLSGCASKTSPSIPPASQAAATLTPACFNVLYARL
jgi:hypothetical protein